MTAHGDRQMNVALRDTLTRLEAERDRLRDLVYNGPQPGQAYGLCTDPVTGSTFAVYPRETIGQALARVDARYQAAAEQAKNREAQPA